MGKRKFLTINRFLGLNKSNDDASLLPGELTTCNNYLVKNNGDLAERGGGAKLDDGPAASRAYGFTNYRNSAGSEWLILVQGTAAYYYDSGWNDTGVVLTTSLETKFEQAGFSTNRNLYGVNGTDSVIKITTSGGVPAGSFVASSPTDLLQLKLHKNRLFGHDGKDTIKFTDANAFETWATGTNEFQVAPGVDGYIKAIEIWGDALFIFKEFGIYVLPNAADAASDWSILKTDALIGTQSPDSVRRTRAGIYYLSTDNKIRVVNPNITFTSGEYVMGGSGSPIVSELIQDYLDENLNEPNKSKAAAVVFKDKYIICLNSVNAGGNENDMCFVADTIKKRQIEGLAEPQPIWVEFTNFEFDYFAIQSVTGENKLYCVDIEAVTAERLDDGTNNDSGNAIESTAILGWFHPEDSGIYTRFTSVVAYTRLENWNLDVTMDSYRIGDFIPEELNGETTQITGSSTNAVVGTAIVGTSLVSSNGIKSEKMRIGLRGNFISIKMENLNANEYTEIQKLSVYYRNIHTE